MAADQDRRHRRKGNRRLSLSNSTDREFIGELKEAVAQFLSAVDAWEAAYQEYYRMPDTAAAARPELDEHQRAYTAARKRLADLVPRARGLCFRHGLRDPWTSLLRTSLGQHAPQNRTDSAVSASERQLVHECLILLTEACTEFAEGDPAPAERRSWVRRVLDWFL